MKPRPRVRTLIGKGLLREVKANRKLGDPVWREGGEGHGLTLIVTGKGLEAIGIEIEPPKTRVRKSKPKPAAGPREVKLREGTRQSAMIALLRQPEGATVDEIAAATGWQKHTVRGAMAGALRKKLGLAIVSSKVEGRGRVYKVAV